MTTYAQLQSDVAAWLDRDDLTTRIPSFIVLAEQEVNRRLRVLEMEELSSTPLSTVSQYYDLPPRFIEARNIYTDKTAIKKLGYVTPEQMVLTTPDSSSSPSPKQYTITDGKIKLDVIMADSNNNLFIAYFKAFEALSETNTTNWLLTNAYALLLYGSVLAAELFLYNDERLPLIKVSFDQIILELNDQAWNARYSGDSLRIRST